MAPKAEKAMVLAKRRRLSGGEPDGSADAPEGQMRWEDRLASHMEEIRQQSAGGKEEFERLLKNLRRQTGLAMEIENREVTAWRVVAE